jgi:hypothetical protein
MGYINGCRNTLSNIRREEKLYCNKATNKKILLAGGMASSSSHSQRRHYVNGTTSTGNDSKQ